MTKIRSKSIILLLIVLLHSVGIAQKRPLPSGKTSLTSELRKKATGFVKSLHTPIHHIGSTKIKRAIEVSSSVSANKGIITIKANLGEAITRHSLLSIENAPTTIFSNLTFTGIDEKNLSSGCIIRSIASGGEPEIPMLIVTCAIAETAENIRASYGQVSSKELKNVVLPPSPSIINGKLSDRIYNKEKYKQPNFDKPILSSAGRFRKVRFVTVSIPLASYSADNSILTVKSALICQVSFDCEPIAARKQERDPVFEDAYSAMVANPQDIAKFSAPFHSSKKISSVTSIANPTFDQKLTDWIDPNALSIKLTTTRTGLYRIGINELQSRSKNNSIATVKASTIRLLNRGKEVPCYIDTTPTGTVNAIEFYGKRFSGYGGEYYSYDTDSNAYWLTNSSKITTTPLRYTESNPTGNIVNTIDEGNITLHHERDLDYYPGDKIQDESKTTQRYLWIDGERFIWKFFNKDNNSLVNQFELPTLPQDIQNKSALLDVFVRGNSTGQFGSHTAAVLVNGIERKVVSFNDTEAIHIQDTIALSALHSGSNTLEIQWRKNGDDDQWYFDHFEISIPTTLEPSRDTSIARGQWLAAVQTSSGYNTVNLSSSQGVPVLYDLTNSTRTSQTMQSGNSYGFTLNALGSNITIAAATESSFLHPDQIIDRTGRWNSILDTTTQTDFIIITHSTFLPTAQKLAAFRTQSGLSSKVVLIDDIYDAFNYGTNEPLAIRSFLRYAYDFYHGVPPSLVTLFGDGTWDPKYNLNNETQRPENRTIHQCFIPTYGNPSSDYIFTLSEGVSRRDSLFPEFVIGRIPVESFEEGESFLNKLVEYESAPPADWNRNFLLVSGGDPGGEYHILEEYTDLFIRYKNGEPTLYGGLGEYPVFARATRVRRTDIANSLDLTHVGEIQSAFKQGQSLVYFFGHGATNITDIQFPAVQTLANPGLYPVLVTLSCRTGAFAESNIITMNESYLRGVRSGVVAAFGTTGFDGREYSFYTSARIFNLMRGDTLYTDTTISKPSVGAHKLKLPVIFTLAKYIESVTAAPTSALEFEQDNSLYEIALLGDAAMGYVFRPQPEFHASASDIRLTTRDGAERSIFSVSDSFVHIQATFRNFGFATSSPVRISFRDEANSLIFSLVDSVSRFDTIVRINEALAIDTTMIGANTLHITVDADNSFAEQNENDNEAVVNFLVSSSGAVQLYPPEGGKNLCDVSNDSVTFISLLSTTGAVSLELQVDTTTAFTSATSLGTFEAFPLFFTHTVSKTLLPSPSSGVIWWRIRTTTPSGKLSEWQVASVSLSTDHNGKSEFSYTTPDQLRKTIVSNLLVSDSGLHISRFDTIDYELVSHGQLDTTLLGVTIPQVFINGESVLDSLFENGVYVAVLTPNNRQLESVYLFVNNGDFSATRSTELIDSLEKVVNAIPTGRRVFVFTNQQPFFPSDQGGPSFSFDPRTTAALQLLGSAHGFAPGSTPGSLTFFGSYALSGIKGAAPGSVPEAFASSGGSGVDLRDTSITFGRSGLARFPATAIATSYGSVRWNEVNHGGDLKLIVLGQRKSDGSEDTLRIINAALTNTTDLSTVDASTYHKLSVVADFQRDTSEGPLLSELELEYAVAPEFEILPDGLLLSPKTIEEGFTATLEYACFNRLCIDAQNVPVIVLRNFSGKVDTIARHTIPLFLGHSSITFLDTITTVAMEGTVSYTVIINPNQLQNEQIAFNNSATTTLTIIADTIKPKLDLVFDGHHINNGDYVQNKVEIELRLRDSSPLRVIDTNAIGGTLIKIAPQGDSPIGFKANQPVAGYRTTFTSTPSGDLQATLTIDPEIPLKPGTYLFSAYAKDASGNTSDTIDNEFIISSKNGLEHVMNYPNPFKDKTSFTFILPLAGRASIRVPIYTIAGRKIRTLELDASKQRVGLNAIEWDGRDENGNDVANGTYLYKVVLNGTNEDGSEATADVLERAVRSR